MAIKNHTGIQLKRKATGSAARRIMFDAIYSKSTVIYGTPIDPTAVPCTKGKNSGLSNVQALHHSFIS